MKKSTVFAVNFLYLIFFANMALGQDSLEIEIRRLENLERESVLKSDSLTLFDKL